MITCRNNLENTRFSLFANRIFRPTCQCAIFTFAFWCVHQLAHRFDDMPACNLHKFHLSSWLLQLFGLFVRRTHIQTDRQSAICMSFFSFDLSLTLYHMGFLLFINLGWYVQHNAKWRAKAPICHITSWYKSKHCYQALRAIYTS